MRFCSQQTLHTNALLRTSKAQMEARSSRRCSTWRNVSQVRDIPRPSVAIGEKVLRGEECPGRLCNAKVCCKHVKCPSMRRDRRSTAQHWLQAARTQQKVSMTKAGRMAGTGAVQAALQRSRDARMQATAQRRHAPPEVLMLLTMTMGQAPRQARKLRRSRQPRDVPRRKSTAPERLRAAAREAQSAQSKAQRASALAQKRSLATESAPPAAAAVAKSAPTAACSGAAAHRRHGQAEKLAVKALGTQRGSSRALKRTSKRRRHAFGKENTTLARLLAAAMDALLAQNSSQHVDGISLKHDQTTESNPSAAQGASLSGVSCPSSQHIQQQGSMQVIWYSQPALYYCHCQVLVYLGSNQHMR